MNASNLFTMHLQKITERKSQGLETGTGGFSKDWKISRKFSRALEKKVAECSKAWKTGGARTWN
jgi:hypothetical protein